MGQAVSFVTSIINTATKLRAEAKQDELDADRRKQDKIKTPIEPPKFYKNIEERALIIKDEKNPYSVESIKQSLNRDVVPVGYSLEQLSTVGFDDSVKKYNERKENRRKELKKEFSSVLGKIEKEVEKGFEDLSKDDRILFEKMGVFSDESRTKILEQLAKWKKQVDEDTATTSMIDDMIELLKSRVDMVQDVFTQGEFEKKIQEQVEQAERKKTSQALMLVRRALNVV
ncbi:MAG: hypothetical protein ACYTCN_02485 [Planctomycetota bacterium]|jgi:hypothetical protein